MFSDFNLLHLVAICKGIIVILGTCTVQVMSNTTTPAKNGSNSSTKPDKKVKYKSLWGKVGKHGLAEAAKEKAAADSSSSSSTGRPLFQPKIEMTLFVTFEFK